MKNYNRRAFLSSSAALMALAGAAFAGATLGSRSANNLRDLFASDFRVGTALSNRSLSGSSPELVSLVQKEFSAITAENAMKWELLRPTLTEWDWQKADRLVQTGEAAGMQVIGHVLVWHSQVPDAVFRDASGAPLTASATLARMSEHIQHVMDRYKGRVQVWDVVNEAVDEGNVWRKSHWHTLTDGAYFPRAFEVAHEADPAAHLLYNDYSMHIPEKRDFILQQLTRFRRQGVPIHGVGMQAHVHLEDPSIAELERSIQAYARAGLRVHITELDVDVLPKAYEYMGAEISKSFAYSDALNPFADGLPQKVADQLARRYEQLFRLFLKYRDDIERVSMWGTVDGESWKNDWPVRGRTNYPLLFNRDGERKSAYHAVANLKRSQA
ncbi:1,4-beta-xylanase [Microbulbifer agarilyticus]|uniref:Beta-xylanase n=1 Tax=Microbulbifer agarilyticus TaxID=260552 RepID=A0A1Q2M2C6_9GAMM|nr:endo-1,4-beta-xylanase [Microbulbifer agarilyticus]AQQ66826.1 1,4-beta-xylanase [Microbulbifer agarilyticus]